MATSKKAAEKKVAAPGTEKPAKKVALKKSAAPSVKKEPVISRETLLEQCRDLAATDEDSMRVASVVLNKTEYLKDSDVLGVINHGLLHYMAVVMSGETILKGKLQDKDAAGLLQIVKAQFSVK